MGARIVGFIALFLLIAGGLYYYSHYKQQRTMEDGAVHCVGCMSPEDEAKFKLENSGDAAVARGEHSESRAQQAANDAATPTQEPVAATPYGMAPQGSVAPGGIMQSNAQPMQNYPQAQAGYVNTSAAMAPPTMETQSANAPNGMRFAGVGSYQWYRQGNLTWRVDTSSGRSCIVYATMEEWRKQIVMSHGCGGNA